MNNEDAVKTLKAWMECMVTDCDYECEHCHIQAAMATDVLEACAIAVTELSQPDTDTISRGAAIEAVKEALNPSISHFVKAKIAIENLPPASDLTEQQATCEYCHEDAEGYVRPVEKNNHAFVRFGITGWELSLKGNGWHGEAPIHFCPMCGRKLQQEA